jgi:glycosyltransferase involved in cell wall biosynthesis
VITPSFNQGEFIEETIRSILLQGYPNLEYAVMDGGSTDNSVETIKKYAAWLSFWVSGPDAGQSDAINRGLKRASGDFATWINSDDLLCKNALVAHASQVGFEAQTVYVGLCVCIDKNGEPISSHRGRVYSLEDLLRIGTVWRSEGHQGHIVQPEVLFPRELALSIGGLDTDNHFTMDYELWGRLFLAGAKFQYTEIPFGMFREHQKQKIHDTVRQTRSLIDSATKLVLRADRFSETTKKEMLEELHDYRITYEKNHWKGTGRLAKLGLPRPVVLQLRRLRTFVQKRHRQNKTFINKLTKRGSFFRSSS